MVSRKNSRPVPNGRSPDHREGEVLSSSGRIVERLDRVAFLATSPSEATRTGRHVTGRLEVQGQRVGRVREDVGARQRGLTFVAAPWSVALEYWNEVAKSTVTTAVVDTRDIRQSSNGLDSRFLIEQENLLYFVRTETADRGRPVETV